MEENKEITLQDDNKEGLEQGQGVSSHIKTMHRLRIASNLIKTIAIAFVLGIFLLMVIRLFSSGDPKSMKTISPNDKILEAYQQYGSNLQLKYQTQATITKAETNYGYFSVTRSVFITDIQQVQLVFRYNNSTLTHLAEDYHLSEVPSKDGKYYDVSLFVTYKEESGIENAARIFATSCEREETKLYTYYRYTFDNVDVTDMVEGVFVDIYYVNDIDYDEQAYGTLLIYNSDEKWQTYRLTSNDKKALRKED